jgi:citrate lyase subunit beta/citryl-CoA lyase
MMAKGAASDADQVFLDLEDACAPSEKKPARALVVEALRTHDFGGTVRCVRVNDVSTPWCYGDILEVVTGAGGQLDALVLPKVESAAHVHFVEHLLDGLEADLGLERRIGLELQIESHRGAVALREIAAAATRAESIVFGPGDYAASMGVAQFEIGMNDERYPGHQWHWVMSEIANHARAIGAVAIDGPYVDFADESGYRESALRATTGSGASTRTRSRGRTRSSRPRTRRLRTRSGSSTPTRRRREPAPARSRSTASSSTRPPASLLR